METKKIYRKTPRKRYIYSEGLSYRFISKTKDVSLLKIKYVEPKFSIRRIILDYMNNQEYINNTFLGIQKDLSYQSELKR